MEAAQVWGSIQKKKYSRIDNIYILKSIVNKYVIRQKQKLYCCCVDIRKA